MIEPVLRNDGAAEPLRRPACATRRADRTAATSRSAPARVDAVAMGRELRPVGGGERHATNSARRAARSISLTVRLIAAQKNARPCQASAALTSHFPACRSPTRESVLSKTRVFGPTVPEAASSANRSRDTRSIASPSRYSTGALLTSSSPRTALELLHPPHERVDRAARHACRALVDADQHELVVPQVAARRSAARRAPSID